MKKIFWLLILSMAICVLAGCSNDTIVGQWTTEDDAEALGLSGMNSFVQTITHLTIVEEGKGSWEIELVESRQILRREFTYTLEGDQLIMSYPDGTQQRFTVSFDKGILNLTGIENYSLKRIQK